MAWETSSTRRHRGTGARAPRSRHAAPHHGHPSPAHSHPLLEALEGSAQLAVTVVGAPLLRHLYNHWGTTPSERDAWMPGDDLIPTPRLGYTRAVTVDAAPHRVWPWLVQIGQGRGGLYSFDALENLVHCDIHSADYILDEYQRLRVGDLVRLGPDGHPCFTAVLVDPPSTLVLAAADPKTHVPGPFPVAPGEVGATWQWRLFPVSGGLRTRLVTRQRLSYPRTQSLMWHVVEPLNFVMERQMLCGIKRRAEGRHRR